MAIREEDKKVQDNMDYKSEKEKMQEENRIEKTDVFNLKDFQAYKDAIKNNKNLKDVFPPNYPVRQLEIFQQLLETQENKS